LDCVTETDLINPNPPKDVPKKKDKPEKPKETDDPDKSIEKP